MLETPTRSTSQELCESDIPLRDLSGIYNEP